MNNFQCCGPGGFSLTLDQTLKAERGFFHADNSGGPVQSFVTGTTKVDYGTQITDNSNWYDPVTSEFQPTKNGIYSITAWFDIENVVGTNFNLIGIFLNGTLIFQGDVCDDASPSSEESFNVNALVELNGTTDIIDIRAITGLTSFDLNAVPQDNYFQGYLVQAL